MSATAIGRSGFGVYAAERPFEVLHHPFKRQTERRAASDQHVVVARPHASLRREPNDLPQAALHTVAFNRVADLLGDGKSDARRSRFVALARLKHKARNGRPRAGCGSEEVRALPQPIHRNDMRVGAEIRLSAACDHVHDGRQRPCGPPWSSCGCDSRDGACAPACWVDRSASREISVRRRAGLYGTPALLVNATPYSGYRGAMSQKSPNFQGHGFAGTAPHVTACGLG